MRYVTIDELRALIKEELNNTKSSNFEQNIKFMNQMNQYWDDWLLSSVARRIYEKQRFKFSTSKISRKEIESNAKELIRKRIPQLSNWKLVKYLGGGAYKHVWLMNNGHVLAISIEGDSDALKKVEDKLWSGHATSRDMGVFDVEDIVDNIWYAEMSEIIPLNIYYNEIAREKKHLRVTWDEVDGMRSFVMPAIKHIIKKRPSYDAKAVEKMIRIRPSASGVKVPWFIIDAQDALSRTESRIGKDLTFGWLKAMIHAAVNYGISTIVDAYFLNIGVSIANPDKMIVFDIS
tara:strand:- start:579 stop:1448 length:870 start_codon:yes stop_codon:yes gene_type:complete